MERGDRRPFDEDYVLEILAAAPEGLSKMRFFNFVTPDRNAGWAAEADEAYRRYFARHVEHSAPQTGIENDIQRQTVTDITDRKP